MSHGTWRCADCGSMNISFYLPQAGWEERPDDWCFHQHPLGPPGRCISMHPKSEPCVLRTEKDT